MDDLTLIQLFAQMDAHTARQDEILAHHSTMLDRVDDRGRQHTDAMLQISANMVRLHDSLDRSMQRLETQQTQLGEMLGGMAAMLARMDEHTTMIAQILSQFQQGRNGHA
jgi:ABC-type transporter Mla subunit MlaD